MTITSARAAGMGAAAGFQNTAIGPDANASAPAAVRAGSSRTRWAAAGAPPASQQVAASAAKYPALMDFAR
jgi:hypothetical protein